MYELPETSKNIDKLCHVKLLVSYNGKPCDAIMHEYNNYLLAAKQDSHELCSIEINTMQALSDSHVM